MINADSPHRNSGRSQKCWLGVCVQLLHLRLKPKAQQLTLFFLASFRSASQPPYGQNSRAALAYGQFAGGEQFQPGGVPQPVSLGSIRQVTTVEHETRPATAEDYGADRTPASSSQPPKFSVRRLFRRAARPTDVRTAPPSDSRGHIAAGPSEQPSEGRFGDLQLDPSVDPSFGLHTEITSQTALPPRRRRRYGFV